MTYSSKPLHMDEQKLDEQLEPTYTCFVPIQDVALKIYRERWTIEKGGRRGSGWSTLVVRHDDDHNSVIKVVFRDSTIKSMFFDNVIKAKYCDS